MRIISGSLKGAKLHSPKGLAVRPTSDKVKEAIFNVLGSVHTLRVLDLYAGSGNLSFEALSRTAENAILIDNNLQAKRSIEQNAQNLKLSNKIKIINLPVNKALKLLKGRQFDVIFADPPYSTSSRQAIKLLKMVKALSLLAKGGIIVYELYAKNKLEQRSFKVLSEKKYGGTKVYFLSL